MKLSPQQVVAVDAIENGKDSIVLEAVAGSGKTSTLIEMLKVTMGSVRFCAFNKAIAQEIKAKIANQNLSHVRVGTLHSFGFEALRGAISRVNVNGNKLQDLAQQEFNGEYQNLRQFVTSAVAMAKEVGIGACVDDTYENWIQMFDHYDLWESLSIEVPNESAVDACQYLLNLSNEITDTIDFADMIYLPILKKYKISQCDNVFLDEAQDTNGPRRELVRMMLKPGGRLVAVGDSHQAIYGFTGADHNALKLIQEQFNAKSLPLSVTFRCPKNVVKVAQQWVNHIESHESSPEGIVDDCEIAQLPSIVTQKDAIICRNTKPLIEVAYTLIRNNVPCKVEGRKIGEGLIKLAQRWKVKTVQQLADKLEDWKEKEILKYREKGNDTKCQIIEDQADTLFVFIDQCKADDFIPVLIEKIKALFDDTQNKEILTLSTIHKSKGREWNRVFALGMTTYSPSKWAKKSWEIQQENNLLYVQVTRAKAHLTRVNVPTVNSK
jgi:superfamily I DNA/RNA helicase